MDRLANKVVMVVGGGTDGPAAPGETLAIGNGRAIALTCAKHGAAVAVIDRDLLGAEETAAAITEQGGKAIALCCDVLSEGDCREAVETVVRRLGGLNGLVNNVGIGDMGKLETTEADEFDRVMAVNVRGHFLVIKHALEPLRQAKGGSIVNISSVSGIRSSRGVGVAYETSKAALLGLTRHVALNAASAQVRANVILPGTINSAMLRRLIGDASKWAANIPLKRAGTPWDVANAALFLLSDESSFITGIEMIVDGGTAMCA